MGSLGLGIFLPELKLKQTLLKFLINMIVFYSELIIKYRTLIFYQEITNHQNSKNYDTIYDLL